MIISEKEENLSLFVWFSWQILHVCSKIIPFLFLYRSGVVKNSKKMIPVGEILEGIFPFFFFFLKILEGFCPLQRILKYFDGERKVIGNVKATDRCRLRAGKLTYLYSFIPRLLSLFFNSILYFISFDQFDFF